MGVVEDGCGGEKDVWRREVSNSVCVAVWVVREINETNLIINIVHYCI